GLSSLQTSSITQIQTGSFQVGATVSSTISQAGEVDVWSFQASAGQRLFFDALSGNTATLHWSLTDSSGGVLFSDNFQDHEVLTAAGTYYLTVDARAGGTGAYQFKVLAEQPPATTPIALNQTVSDSILAPGEQDRYTFTGATGQRVFFDVQNSAGGQLSF